MTTDEKDLQEDLHELLALATSAARRLRFFRLQLLTRPGIVRTSARASLMPILDTTLQTYARLCAELRRTLHYLDDRGLHEALALKHEVSETLRMLQGIAGSLLASTDWQSPSFKHALHSEAGKQTGKIIGTFNDYKRDRHLDAKIYEQQFRRAYLDFAPPLFTTVCVTSSGMAAFTTVIGTLQLAKQFDGPLLVGKNCYFQNKILLSRLFADRITQVDEFNTDEIVAAAESLQPCAIFLDSLCNTQVIAMPHLKELFPRLAKAVRRPCHLVLDNTGLAIMHQPLRVFPFLQNHLQLIVIESLNKYHQFGFDRVTGGVIWTVGLNEHGLTTAREHLGTIMPDASVLSLPVPNRVLLTRRMMRLGRNAQHVSEALQAHIEKRPQSPISHVVYPGLPSYPGHAWTKTLPFHGAFLTFAFKPGIGSPALYKRFLHLAMEEAGLAKVPLNAGTSFGFNTTRVYLTALMSTKMTTPFLRIAVGTETKKELERLVEVLRQAIDRL